MCDLEFQQNVFGHQSVFFPRFVNVLLYIKKIKNTKIGGKTLSDF